MGSDLYLAGRLHRDESWGALASAIRRATKALKQDPPDVAEAVKALESVKNTVDR